MGGRRDSQAAMRAFVDLDERVPNDHPLPTIKAGTGLWEYDQENPAASYHERGLYIIYFGDLPDAEGIREAMDKDIKYNPIESDEDE